MGNFTRIDLNQSGIMAESDAPRMAKWRRRVFWMACGLLGAKVWSTLLTLGMLFAPMLVTRAWSLPEGYFLRLAVNFAVSAPLVWLLFSGRLEGLLASAARCLENPRQLRLWLVIAVAVASLYPVVLSLWQARFFEAMGHGVTVARLRTAHLLTLVWPLALGCCIWRLAPGRSAGRQDVASEIPGLVNLQGGLERASNFDSFDLESEIARWRQNCLASGSITMENARELEAHLRDIVAAQIARGLLPAEAFRVATNRLGDIAALAAEFDREDPATKWRHRLFWMVGALFGLHLLQSGFGLVTVAGQYWLANHQWSRSIEYYHLTSFLPEFAALGLGWLLLRGKLDVVTHRAASRLRTRWAVGTLALALQVTMTALLYAVASYGITRFLVPSASQLIGLLLSLVWLPAWLILLVPVPKLSREKILS